VFYALRAARRAGADAEAARLDAELRRLTAAAGALEEANAFGALLQRAGAVGLNATTSHDATKCATLAWHTRAHVVRVHARCLARVSRPCARHRVPTRQAPLSHACEWAWLVRGMLLPGCCGA